MSSRVILPPELKESDRAEYERLRNVKLLNREEAVQAIKMNRSRKIVSIISEAASKDIKPKFVGSKPNAKR